MRRVIAVLGVLSIVLAACKESEPAPPLVDSGLGMDGSFDAGRDAGMDSGSDAGVDSGSDSGMDSGMDAALDASSDNDATVVECTRNEDCDDGIACTLDLCVSDACESTAPDNDHDGHAAVGCVDGHGEPLGDDCNDDELTVYQGAPELCDTQDNDCDAFIDESLQSVAWYPDTDGDSFGDASGTPIVACAPVTGRSMLATDCDDNNSTAYPGNAEVCDAIDNDCDNLADDGVDCGASVYLKADVTAALDGLGASVALSGDTLVVGAPGQSAGGNSSGAAYVFVRVGEVWAQQAQLVADNAEANDQFGTSVAIDGDTIVVGAPHESSSATGINGDGSTNGAASSGAAYVFVRSGTTWTQQAYVKSSNAEAQDRFGFSVGVAGDTVVVGAYQEDSSASGIDGDGSDNTVTDSGAAYVFTRNAGMWSEDAYVKAATATAGDGFGYSIAIDGDTVIVGAPYRGSSRGAAYVFLRSGGTWMQERYLSPQSLDPGDSLGFSVAVSRDTFAVGAPYEDSNSVGVGGDELNNNALDSGAVQVFQRGGMQWMRRYLKASNVGAGDHFGWSVAIEVDSILIGAPSEGSDATGVNGDPSNDSAVGSGAAYVFTRVAGAWSETAYLKSDVTEAGDNFGSSVSTAGNTLVVGASSEDSNATGVNGDAFDNSASQSGAAYVFQ